MIVHKTFLMLSSGRIGVLVANIPHLDFHLEEEHLSTDRFEILDLEASADPLCESVTIIGAWSTAAVKKIATHLSSPRLIGFKHSDILTINRILLGCASACHVHFTECFLNEGQLQKAFVRGVLRVSNCDALPILGKSCEFEAVSIHSMSSLVGLDNCTHRCRRLFINYSNTAESPFLDARQPSPQQVFIGHCSVRTHFISSLQAASVLLTGCSFEPNKRGANSVACERTFRLSIDGGDFTSHPLHKFLAAFPNLSELNLSDVRPGVRVERSLNKLRYLERLTINDQVLKAPDHAHASGSPPKPAPTIDSSPPKPFSLDVTRCPG
jgi:hypothetical protein